MRLGYLFLPRFPVQRRVLEQPSLAGRPVVLNVDEKGSQRVRFASGAALKRGVRPGATVASSMALEPSLVRLRFDADAEARALSSLGERSVAWYAQEAEPRIGNNGKPFPPRPEDVLLRNAARTLIHQKRGTLPSAAVPTAPVANIDEGDVSF
jgi:hypothetical protein